MDVERNLFESAVFDLDGTLLHGDSTGFWLRDMLGASWSRFVFALLLAPLALPLVRWRLLHTESDIVLDR
jgi:phosphatidylglycerophosphatase C